MKKAKAKASNQANQEVLEAIEDLKSTIEERLSAIESKLEVDDEDEGDEQEVGEGHEDVFGGPNAEPNGNEEEDDTADRSHGRRGMK